MHSAQNVETEKLVVWVVELGMAVNLQPRFCFDADFMWNKLVSNFLFIMSPRIDKNVNMIAFDFSSHDNNQPGLSLNRISL